MKVSPAANKKIFDVAPRESAGPTGKGAECHYGDIMLQIDTFSWSSLEGMMKKDGTPVPGVGDAAMFRDNSGRFAELAARVGNRTLIIQMGVPFTSTTENVKPNVMALANAIAPQLK